MLVGIKDFSKVYEEQKMPKKIRGWFISLFNFKKKPRIYENIIITSGDLLIPFLGEEIYIKLKEVKNSFKR